jgi:hypothetical protein
MSRFAFVIETYQLALSDIHHLYLYIRFRVHDVAQQLGVVPINLPENVALTDAAGREAFRSKCAEIGERLNDITLYIGDFRIEVMNSLVGPLFDRRVPRRRPAKASVKTLVELATPEAVAEENQRRIIEAVADGVELTRTRERPA